MIKIVPPRYPSAWTGSSNSAASSSGPWYSGSAGAASSDGSAQNASASVLIGNIPHDALEDDVQQIFSLMGTITFFHLVKDSVTGASKGCAICDYVDMEMAQECVKNMNGFDFQGKQLRVGVVNAAIKARVLESQAIATGAAKPAVSGLKPGALEHLRSLAQAKAAIQASSLAAQGGGWQQPSIVPAQPVGVPPEFAEQLRQHMLQAENQTGKACRFGKTCKSVDCPNIHAEGRDIMDDPSSLICRFGRKCMRSSCFYVHPAGRDLDEDPAKGMCINGAQCPRPDCYFKHPDTRSPVIQVKCFNCKQYGHISKECTAGKPPARGHVCISDFPEEWTSVDESFLVARITAELEAFGQLAQPPELSTSSGGEIGGGWKAMAVFNDVNAAKQAVEALNGAVFTIEFREAQELGPGGVDKSCTVFIGNIPYDITEDDLKDWFCDVGFVVNVRLVREKDSQVLKGYGFVDFETKQNADDAIYHKNNAEFKGRRMRVTPADNQLGEQRSKREYGSRQGNCTLEISDFPQRWEEEDLIDFLRGALKGKESVLHVTIEEAVDDTPRKGSVSFPSAGDARRARQDLKVQKIAGKPLRVWWVGDPNNEEDQEGDSKAGKWDDFNDQDERNGERNGKRDGGRERKERKKHNEHVLVCLHIDELAMPDRPQVEPAQEDCEVWVDPLPDDDMLGEWIAAFGKEKEVYRIPDAETGEPGDRGYITFEDHEAAERCVASGSGTWSESERTLSSQVSRRGGRESSYPESFVALLLGPKGETIRKFKEEMGASMLSLRGESLGENERMESKRVHFVCKGTPEAIEKLQPVLEAGLAKLHVEMKDKIENGVPKGRQAARERDNERGKRRRSRSRRRDRDHNAPWVPSPGFDPYAPPPPGYFPFWAPPPGYGPPPPGFPPPPGHPPHWPPPPGFGLPPPGYPPPEEGDSDFPPGYHGGPPGPPPPGYPPPPGPPPMHDGPPDEFLAQLPPHLTLSEEALQDAVLSFLETWEADHPEGVHAKLIHLGGDPRVRDCKTDALPSELPLKAWIRHRLHHQITIDAQTVKLIPGANLDRCGPPLPRPPSGGVPYPPPLGPPPGPPPGNWPRPTAAEHWRQPSSFAGDDRPPGYLGPSDEDDALYPDGLPPENWDPNDEIDAIWGSGESGAGLRPDGHRERERSRRRGRRHRRRAPG